MLRFVKWLAGFATIALLVLIVVNTIDSDLSPTAAEWLRPVTPESSVTGNGFYLLLGIDAPAQEDAFETGRARLLAIRDCERRARAKADWEAEFNCSSPALDLQQFRDLRDQCADNASLLLCIVCATDTDVWRKAIDIPPHVAARIDGLLELDRFREPLDSAHSSPISVDQFNATRLQVAHTAISFVDNDLNAALEQLLALEMWTRNLLLQSENYLERVVAIANLAIAISALDALELAARQRGQQIDIDYRVLSEEELDWSRTVRGEMRWVAQFMREQAQAGSSSLNHGYWERFTSWLEQRFHLQNSLVNDMVAQARARMTYFNAPRADYLARRREALGRDAKPFSFGDLGNLLGYFTMGVVPELSYAKYSDELRLIDQRLWLLDFRQDLWGANVAPNSVAATLSGLGFAAYDPYFGQAVRWDADAAQLVIDIPSDIEAGGRIAVDYSLATDCGR